MNRALERLMQVHKNRQASIDYHKRVEEGQREQEEDLRRRLNQFKEEASRAGVQTRSQTRSISGERKPKPQGPPITVPGSSFKQFPSQEKETQELIGQD